MPSSTISGLFLSIPSLFLLIFTIRIAESVDPTLLSLYCPNTALFAPKTTFQTNRDLLLSSLASNAIQPSGFYDTTVSSRGGGSAVYGLFLCRGDDSLNTCQTCVKTAVNYTLQNCPTGKVAIVWYDECTIRYSNESFFGGVDYGPTLLMSNTTNVSGNATAFMELVVDTMSEIAAIAANDGSGKKFATKQVNFTASETVYGLGQCTPDLSATQCRQCLSQCIGELPSCCSGVQGGRALFASCNVRYETYPFYRLAAGPAPTAAPVGPAPTAAPGPPPILFPPAPAPSTGANATASELPAYFCTGGDDVDSTYRENLHMLLSFILPSSQNDYGFYNISYGQDNDQAYAIALCRGDVVKADQCLKCFNHLALGLTDKCPTKEAIGWQDGCMLRYSNRSIFRLEENEPSRTICNIGTSKMPFVPALLGELLRNLTNRAAKGDWRLKFAAGKTNSGAFSTMYALTQCTPDLPQLQCRQCLEQAISDLQSFSNCLGGVIYQPSCNLEFQLYPFYDDNISVTSPKENPANAPLSSISVGIKGLTYKEPDWNG
ncbi:hypothetical protein Ancab_040252 [Ancistrocladus abbreviatus]